MITIFTPAGIGEVAAGDDVVDLILQAVSADAAGPLADGDVVVVTSKIISKAEGRQRPAESREGLLHAETVRVVAARGPVRIVKTTHGLTLAGAGIDNSNVSPDTILLLPADADASAQELARGLRDRTGLRVGVVISDTAGRAWRIGQTDQAIGAAGVVVSESYAGRTDAYGNPLAVTEMALADELAAAADLVKGKLSGSPIAIVRGLSHLVTEDIESPGARSLVRDSGDMFAYGTREAVLVALLRAVGLDDRYDELVLADPRDVAELIKAAARDQALCPDTLIDALLQP